MTDRNDVHRTINRSTDDLPLFTEYSTYKNSHPTEGSRASYNPILGSENSQSCGQPAPEINHIQNYHTTSEPAPYVGSSSGSKMGPEGIGAGSMGLDDLFLSNAVSLPDWESSSGNDETSR